VTQEGTPASQTVSFFARFDGETTGLREHALSIAAFDKSLKQLLLAFRHAVSDEPNSRRIRGPGRLLDLQLFSVEDGCVRVGFRCALIEHGEAVESSLARVATDRVLRDLGYAADGVDTGNVYIKRFLESLPEGVERQQYEGFAGDERIGEVRITSQATVARIQTAPQIQRMHARVTGVKFRPNRLRVVLGMESGAEITCVATLPLVDRAVELRNDRVLAQVLSRQGVYVLLNLCREGEDFGESDPERRTDEIMTRWDELLKRLAQ
jgi:hypothetical protein